MDSVKMLMNVQGVGLAQFQNAMDSGKSMMKKENKCHTKFLDEMDPMMRMERTPLMPMKQTLCHPGSKQSPVRMREPRKTYRLASTSTAEKTKAPINKVRVGMVPLPDAKAVTAKLVTRSNMRRMSGGHVEPQARREQHASQDQHMKEDIAVGVGHEKASLEGASGPL
jgi:hypothetical protein